MFINKIEVRIECSEFVPSLLSYNLKMIARHIKHINTLRNIAIFYRIAVYLFITRYAPKEPHH